MKRYLLPETGHFYKANLHCHTTVSDGHFTPEEIKKTYMEQGYSVIAFTDHEILIPHPELRDEHFLPLNSVEISVNEKLPEGANGRAQRCCHLCMIALDEENVTQPCWHREKYLWGNAKGYRDQVKFDEKEPDYQRVYSVEGVNDIIRRFRDAGFFVTYNHPVWSQERYEDYMQYEGMQAMEIYNHSSYHVVGCDEYVPYIYDCFLREDRRLLAVATDDNHSEKDACGGYVMIKAPALAYRDVTCALEAGEFYSSTGAEIKALWFEDGKIHVECAPATRIVASYGVRRTGAVNSPDGSLTEAAFPVEPGDKFVRITVTDAAGKVAHTNAYFTENLFEED